MGLPARAHLVLRFGFETAGIMALVQLFFRRPAGAADHSPALNGRASVATVGIVFDWRSRRGGAGELPDHSINKVESD